MSSWKRSTRPKADLVDYTFSAILVLDGISIWVCFASWYRLDITYRAAPWVTKSLDLQNGPHSVSLFGALGAAPWLVAIPLIATVSVLGVSCLVVMRHGRGHYRGRWIASAEVALAVFGMAFSVCAILNHPFEGQIADELGAPLHQIGFWSAHSEHAPGIVLAIELVSFATASLMTLRVRKLKAPADLRDDAANLGSTSLHPGTQ